MSAGVRAGAARAAAACAFVLFATSCSNSFGMPRSATEQGQETLELWQVFFIASIPVAAIVYGLILWSIVRYRRRRSDDDGELGAQFKEHRGLEFIYTGIPILMVIGLFALSAITEDRVSDLSPDPDVTVEVEAFAWGWRFGYPDTGIEIVSEPSGEGIEGPQMVVPLGQTTRIVLTSTDVIHAFWVPGFLYKHDAIPGRTFEFDVTPTRTGTFLGECAEYCGLNHAYMTFSVRVVEPDAFASWLADRQRAQGTTA